MRELFRGLIEADKELPRTMVIAQLHWRRLAAPAHYEQVKQKGNGMKQHWRVVRQN